ncbi:SDR family NAD(P)-dependent oxidoreductase, partial [Komagataeibacter intermedius]
MKQIAMVTGATAGFGRAIAQRLVHDGYRVIATGRRQERLDALAAELGPDLLPFRLDMDDADAIAALPGSLPQEWRDVDILVSNAGLALGMEKAQEADITNWQTMISTNVTGMVELTRVMLPGMVARERGHVVTLGSTAGTYPYTGGNVYGATKAFVRQFTRNLRCDLLGHNVRVTNLEPGLCGGSEFSQVRLRDNAKAEAVYEGTKPLLPTDIAE